MLLIALVMLMPAASGADVNYTFIKLTCSPESQSATINIFYDWNDSGKAKVEHHEENVYYLDDIAKEPKKKVKCDLGKGEVISFIAWHDGAHMAHDNLEVRLNDMGIGSFFINLQIRPEMSIQVLGPADVSTTICSVHRGHLTKCNTRHIKNGKTIAK